MEREDWLTAFASAAGERAPTAHEVEQLLAIATMAAQVSERTAAPLSCWIAGHSELTLDELRAVAARLAQGEPGAGTRASG